MNRTAPGVLILLAALAAVLFWALSEDPDRQQPIDIEPTSETATDGALAKKSEEESPRRADLGSDTRRLSGDAASDRTENGLEVQVEWPDGSAASGIEIRLFGGERALGFRELMKATTDQDGRVRFDLERRGRVNLRTRRGDWKAVKFTDPVQQVQFVLEDGVDVSGLVRDAEEQPIPGASIWLQTRDSTWNGGYIATKSGADGRFFLERVRPVVSLAAIAPLYAPSDLTDLETLDTSRSPVELTLRLTRPGGDVTGTITDPAGQPIADAVVGIGSRGGYPGSEGERVIEKWSLRSTRTDAQGRYALRGLEPGDEPLTVFHLRFGFTRSTCTVVEGETVTHDLTLMPSGVLTGVATYSDGSAVVGAVVRCYDVAPDIPFLQGGQIDFEEPLGHLTATTDAAGRYELKNVSAGTVHVFAQPGKNARTDQTLLYDRAELEMPPGGALEWNPVLSAGRSIEGVVLFRDGFPMEHVFLTLTDEKTTEQRVATNDKDGRFRFIRLDGASYSIQVQYWSAPKGTPPLEVGGLVPDQGQVELRAPFDKPVEQEPGLVIGRIDDTGLRVTDWSEVRVALMSDERWYKDNGEVKDGAFRFEEVKPCRFRLALMHGKAELASSEWFELTSGAQLDTGILTTVPGGSVRVRATRVPELKDAEVTLWLRRDGAARSTTAEMGRTNEILVENLTPGLYELSSYPSGAVPIVRRFEVTALGVSELEFAMTPGVPLDLEAWFPDGSPPTRYTTRILDPQGQVVRSVEGEIGTRSTRPLATIVTVPRGQLRIELLADGRLSHSAEVDTREQTGRAKVKLEAVR